MNKSEVMRTLTSAGTAQNRKVYARHGVQGEMFGVSFAYLGRLQKEIKVDQKLAAELWETGNHDARVLATMIADPDAMTATAFHRWARAADNYVIAHEVANVASRSPNAGKLLKRWTKARAPFEAAIGWQLLAKIAPLEKEVGDDEVEKLLQHIEKNIHASHDRVRYCMNNAVIGIGLRNPTFEKKALRAAKRIGKVEVDHGDTGCKTPDAAPYLLKAAAHRRKTAAGRAAKKPASNKTAKKRSVRQQVAGR